MPVPGEEGREARAEGRERVTESTGQGVATGRAGCIVAWWWLVIRRHWSGDCGTWESHIRCNTCAKNSSWIDFGVVTLIYTHWGSSLIHAQDLLLYFRRREPHLWCCGGWWISQHLCVVEADGSKPDVHSSPGYSSFSPRSKLLVF